MSNEREILVIGTRNVGKTCYAAQVYRRLQEQSGELRLLRPPVQLSLVEKAMESIADGESPVHTPTGAHDQIEMELFSTEAGGFSLTLPDYGGEQITRMLETRSIPAEWVKRTQQADAWLLFLRLSTLEFPSTVLERVVLHKPAGSGEALPDAEPFNARDPSRWDPNAYHVELLQMLLHARSTAETKKAFPRLGIVLSCWDELHVPEGTPPERLLQERLPLLHAFIKAHWQRARTAYFGLAATGVNLAQSGAVDAAFLRDWFPEEAGFVVLPEGQKNPDLTLPISWGIK